MSVCINFREKMNKKVAHEKTYRLKLEFYNTERKMKNIIRRIIISIIMYPNFIQFRQKISFKSALEIFTPVNMYFITALNIVIKIVKI